jgi:two-component system sensor histidine kinase BaeS
MSHPHRGRRRPPWWPANEPWPPTDPPWRRVALIRRAAFAVVLLLGLLVAAAMLAAWLAVLGLRQLGLGGAAVPLVLAGAVVAAISLLSLALRRVARPMDAWLTAAAKVEAGDFTARLPLRGPHDLRRLARAFNAMTERLQADEARRRSLMADITHELRTPLTVIQGQVEGILDGVYPADQDHLLPVLDEARVLSRLIDDLRTLSLVEAGALKLQREPTDLGVLVGETVAAFRGQAESAHVSLGAVIEPGLPLVDVDPVRVREVIGNLLANAIRYTPGGGAVSVSCGSDTESVLVTVRDTGSGIAPEALPSIFARFYRSSDSRGSGLGLAIAKDLVEAHGGRIAASSELEKGTTVSFWLPRQLRSL